MRLYVLCPNTRQPIYLANVVEYRTQLMPWFTLSCPHEPGFNHTYSRDNVIPEPELGALGGGAVAGGLVGLLGGPLGIILGGMIGATLGASAEEEERRRVQRFG
jgi:hypothetical protein